jgi:hypothetical protein
LKPAALPATLPPYVQPPGTCEEAQKYFDVLAEVLHPVDDAAVAIARLTGLQADIAKRKGKRLDPEDRAAIVEAAADELQSQKSAERIAALEAGEGERVRPVIAALSALPDFYTKALEPYRVQLVNHFVEAVAPAFPSPEQARRTIEPLLPLSNYVAAFISGTYWLRAAHDNPVALAREHLHYLAELTASRCPWSWPPK